ncbi:MAG TPA: PAS domain S-box protein [Methanoregula sp.]|nr:PAS domain S-box protein [Methanoregula sp.]
MYSLLYIDDEPALLEIGKLFLENTGDFTVTGVMSGEEALDKLSKNHFDAIVADYQMRGMDGIALLKTVRELYGDIPYILFTGKGREEIVIAAINNGADFYLQKGGEPKAQFAELAHKLRQAITRIATQKALLESEKRLTDIINFLPDATIAIDTRGKVIAWNRAMEEMTGTSAETVLDTRNYEYAVIFYGERRPMLVDLVLSPDKEFEKDHYLFTRRTTTTLTAETMLEKKRGTRVFLWGKASRLFNADGIMTGAIESIRDITDIKETEIELRAANEQLVASAEELQAQCNELTANRNTILESEEKYRTLVEHSQDGIFIAQDGRLVFHNRGFREILGYAEGELDGVPLENCLATEDREKVVARHYSRLAGKPEPEFYECMFLHKDGSFRRVKMDVGLASYLGKPAAIGTIHDVTDERRREEELQKSEENYRKVVENIQDVIYRTDRDGRLVMVSPSGATLLGYHSLDELLGKSVRDTYFMFPEKREELYDTLYRDGSVKNFEVVLRKKDGTPVTVSTSSHLYYGKDGTVLGIEGIFHDITGLTQKENALKEACEQIAVTEMELRQRYGELAQSGKQIRESETRLRYLLDFYKNAKKCEAELFQEAIEGAGIITASPMGYLALLNDDESELTMYSWSENAMAECRMKNKPRVYKTEKTGLWGEAVRQRKAIITNDYAAPNPKKKGIPQGHPEIVRHMNVPLIDEGHIIFVMGVANKEEEYTDEDNQALLLLMEGLWQVIKKKRAEDAVAKSEMKYRMLVENSHDIIYTINPRGIFTFVSPAWTTFLGHPVEVVTGKSYEDFVHPDDIRQFNEFIAGISETGKPLTGLTHRVIHADGSIRFYTSNISPVFDEHSALVSYICTARDITAIRQSENAIQEANRKLSLLNSVTRHDMKNQLAVILGYTQLAALEKTGPAVADFLGRIEDSLKVIQRQIEFMRMYQDLGVKTPVWHRIDSLIGPARPADICVSSTCGEYEIFADPMIGKVFYNLFDNSLRHGKTVTRIAVRCDSIPEKLVITVEDNGTGIPPEEKQKIFLKGYGKNTGFGLFLTREILAITGMSIEETGTPGNGARFEITVPKGTFRKTEK